MFHSFHSFADAHHFPVSLLTPVALSFAPQISVVAQEPILFARSIRENIKYGKEDANDEEMYAAAKLANAHRFISDFPVGYDTGERKKIIYIYIYVQVQYATTTLPSYCFLSTNESIQPNFLMDSLVHFISILSSPDPCFTWLYANPKSSKILKKFIFA